MDRPRVLGARVEAPDPVRASLAPGERGQIDWLVAGPEGTPTLSWAFAVCVPPEGNVAAPRCTTAVVATGAGTTTGEVATMDFDVPVSDALFDAKALLVLAAFCPVVALGELPSAGGAAAPTALDARTFTATCRSGEPLLASLVVRLASAGVNANPPPPMLRLGDSPIPVDDLAPAGGSCAAAPAAPKFHAGGPEVDLVYAFREAEREPDESIMLATIVTSGELDRQYSAFDPGEAPKEVRVRWTPPGKEGIAEGGRIVRFYAIVRDGRGGANFSRFAVCVVPE